MRALRWGMVGGGIGAGIAPTHRRAARLDGRFELLAGAFSRDAQRNRASGAELGIAPERVYADFATMADAESSRPDGIECVSVVTGNDSHAPASLAFLHRGIDVICDKPIATSLADALAVEQAAAERGVLFALTHNYSAYPLVLEARHLIRSGELGEIRIVDIEFAQGRRARLLPGERESQLPWRADTAKAGPSIVLGDIGSHAHHLLLTMTGLEVESLSAELMTIVPGRKADDNANVNLRFRGGARGRLWASMVATGNGHGLRIRIFGDKASLHWDQDRPGELHLRAEDARHATLLHGAPYLCDEAKRVSRTKSGHPEGYFGAFANVYTDAAEVIAARRDGRTPPAFAPSFATAHDGVLCMAFIEAAVASHRRGGAWISEALNPAAMPEAAESA